MRPSLGELVGRYECTTEGHNKFWELTYNKDKGLYEARWGAIGSAGQGPTEYTGDQARKKIQEKLAKGYGLVGNASERDEVTRDAREAVKNHREKVDFMKELKKA